MEPDEIIAGLEALESEIAQGLVELKDLLK